jgi:hypothetical protein
MSVAEANGGIGALYDNHSGLITAKNFTTHSTDHPQSLNSCKRIFCLEKQILMMAAVSSFETSVKSTRLHCISHKAAIFIFTIFYFITGKSLPKQYIFGDFYNQMLDFLGIDFYVLRIGNKGSFF